MPIVIFILTRLVFIASLVFIFGYVFGNFSKNARLTRLTRVASVLILVSFIAINATTFLFAGRWRCGNFNRSARFEAHCHRTMEKVTGQYN